MLAMSLLQSSSPMLCFSLENLLLRGNIIDLNNAVLKGLTNATLLVRIMMLNELDQLAPPPPPEEPLIEVTIPLAELLSKQGGIVQFDGPL